MLEGVAGRLFNGLLWGLGAGLVLTASRGGGEGLRTVTKTVLKGYIAVADRVQEAAAEARENFEDMAAEVRTERTNADLSVSERH